MALPSSGTITLAQVQTEFGGSNPISMSEYYRNGAYVTSNNTNVPTSGTISMSNFYGASKMIGLTWTIDANPSGWAGNAYCGAYGNGRYVIGSSGSSIIYSTDGVNWSQTNNLYIAWGSQTSNVVSSIRYLNGQFVAVGGGGKVATSPDGVTWTNKPGLSASTWGSTGPVYDIAWSGSYYMVVGGATNAVRAVSTDLVTWTNLGFVNTIGTVRTVAYGNGRFVIGGNQGGYAGYSTNNGATWTTQVLPGGTASQTGAINSIVYANGMFVCLSRGTYYWTSTDGITWTDRKAAWTAAGGIQSSAYPQAAAWTGSNWVFANGNSNTPIIVSANGTTGFTGVANAFGAGVNYLNAGVVISNGAGQAVAATSVGAGYQKIIKSP